MSGNPVKNRTVCVALDWQSYSQENLLTVPFDRRYSKYRRAN